MSSTSGNGTHPSRSASGAPPGGHTEGLRIPAHGGGRLRAPWAPGQSGNPSGGSRLLHKVRSRCLALIERRGFDDLESLLQDENAMVRLQALRLLLEYGLGRPAVLPESAWAPDPDPDTQQQPAQVDAAAVFDRENPALSNERRISLLAYGNPELVTCPKCGGPGAFTQIAED